MDPITGVALSFATGFLGNMLSGQKQITAINNRVAATNAEAANKVRTASNANAAAQGALARWTQSLNNNRRLDAGGEALTANTVNMLRRRDAGVVQGFSEQIKEAEQLGGQAAAAAVIGQAGDVVDVINSTTALRNSIVREQTRQFEGMASYDSLQRAAGIVQQTVSSLDNSLLFDALDYNRNVAQQQQSQSYFQSGMANALGTAFKYAAAGTNPFAGASKLLDGTGMFSGWSGSEIVASANQYALTGMGAKFGMSTGVPAPYLLR